MSSGFAVDLPVAVASLVLGPLVALLATLPGLRRGLRRPVAAALDDRGVAAGFGASRLDRFVARTRFLPGSTRMGIRNVLRQKRRSTATVAQLTLAVAAALALVGLGSSIRATNNDVDAGFGHDIVVEANRGAPPIDATARAAVEATPGVEEVSPVLAEEVEHGGETYTALGLDGAGLYPPSLDAGRWFTDAETASAARVAVVGPAMARANDLRVGETFPLDTTGGRVDVEVVGIDTANVNMGRVVFLPLTTLGEVSGDEPRTSDELWVAVSGAGDGPTGRSAIDTVALAVDDRLRDAGRAVDVERIHVQQADELEAMDATIGVQRLLGLLIVAVSVLGLVNALTMSVLERTREIGVLRSLGARGRDIRRAFTAEALTLVALGWLAGIPAGWLLLQGMRALARSLTDMVIPSVFPAVNHRWSWPGRRCWRYWPWPSPGGGRHGSAPARRCATSSGAGSSRVAGTRPPRRHGWNGRLGRAGRPPDALPTGTPEERVRARGRS